MQMQICEQMQISVDAVMYVDIDAASDACWCVYVAVYVPVRRC
jgi:hypothetical protein